MQSQKTMDFEDSLAWTQVSLELTSCVDVDTLLYLSLPQFLCLQDGESSLYVWLIQDGKF